MSLKEKEEKIISLEEKLNQIKDTNNEQYKKLKLKIDKYKEEVYSHLSPYDQVYLARKSDRPHIYDYIDYLFDDFIEFKGDRYFKDDRAIVGGIAYFNKLPVTIIGHQKGRNLEENMTANFGMGSPEGYRKAMRLMKQAEKFNRPIITFIDTPGAYPGVEAEANGIGEAIGQSLMLMSDLKVPIIVFIVGEGGSGGALALGIGDHICMLENAVYSILSPEGFSSILWKDTSSESIEKACEVMKLTSKDLKELHIIDEVVPEVLGGISLKPSFSFKKMRTIIETQINKLIKVSSKDLINNRYKKFRKIGEVIG